MNWPEIAIPLALSGFHIAITLLALWRARQSLLVAGRDGQADRWTLVRLASLRLVAVVVVLSGCLLAVCTPLLVFGPWIGVWLPTSQRGAAILLAGTWLVWIPSTILLDNLALRWWKLRSK